MTPHRERRLRLYGHRGAAAERPENTIGSFARAIELGADALEMDVHQTADGQVVVSHDPSGKRTAGVNRLIRESTLTEVQSWDVGRGFVDDEGNRPFSDRGYRIPKLAEVLERFPKTTLNVDIKQIRPTIVEAVLALVRLHGAEQRVAIASFDTATVQAVRATGYRGATVLSRNEVMELLALPLALRHLRPVFGHAVQVPERFGPVDFSARWFVERCHALGLRIDYWTVNDPLQAQRLLARGADGLMTDDPAALRAVIERWRCSRT